MTAKPSSDEAERTTPVRPRRAEPAPRRRRRRVPWVLIAVGALLVAAVGAWQLYATLWMAHSARVGTSLVHHFLQNHALSAPVTTPARPVTNRSAATPSTATLAACKSGAGARTAVHGLLEIPSIGVVAPVEQGIGDAQLAVAVGHDPHSVWPGEAGNAVLMAHDVSYFATISKLSPGATIRYVTPCTTYVFHVAGHAIVTQGSPVYNTTTPSMTLVTCWPTDALWFTPDRYLVTATEVSKGPTGASTAHYLTATPPPSVPVPSQLAQQGVTLSTYSLPMGTFTLAGSPNPAWAQTTSPLLVDGSAIEAFIAGVKSLTENRLDWWQAIAPHVAPPAVLVGAHNPGYLTPMNVIEHASGAGATSVTLSVTVTVSGGTRPGRYALAVRTAIRAKTLTITSWTMTPA